jgi:hypothetical protein
MLVNEFNYEVDKLETERSLSEQKYGLKDLQSNPWKLSKPSPIKTSGLKASPSATSASRTEPPASSPANRPSPPSETSTKRPKPTSHVCRPKQRRQSSREAMDTTDAMRQHLESIGKC